MSHIHLPMGERIFEPEASHYQHERFQLPLSPTPLYMLDHIIYFDVALNFIVKILLKSIGMWICCEFSKIKACKILCHDDLKRKVL